MSYFLSLLKNCRNCFNKVLKEFKIPRSRETPELCYAVNCSNERLQPSIQPKDPLSVLNDIIDNGFLWAVPKSRRSLERRMTRRMGFGKLYLPKKNLVVCETCGHFHEVHTVCGNCYKKVKEETELMKEAIEKELKLDPIDKEVVVLYEDDPKNEKMFEGKRIVELPKERPQWFSKNLLAKDSELRQQKRKSIGMAQIQPTVTDEK